MPEAQLTEPLDHAAEKGGLEEMFAALEAAVKADVEAFLRRGNANAQDFETLLQTVHRRALATVRIPVKPITRSGGKPITRSDANRSPVPTQTDHLSERSDAGRNHESRFSVRVDGRLRFRIESPFRSSLYALCTRRSRIALASVGSPMTSCHLRLPPISRTG